MNTAEKCEFVVSLLATVENQLPDVNTVFEEVSRVFPSSPNGEILNSGDIRVAVVTYENAVQYDLTHKTRILSIRKYGAGFIIIRLHHKKG